MAKVIYDDLNVCVDYVQLIANGECGEGPDGMDPEENTKRVADAQVKVWGSDATNLVVTCDENCDGWFSWCSCDGCESELAGERHPAAIIR